MPELLTVKEVSKILRVTPRTVMNYIDTRKIPAIQIGGVWRIKREELDKILTTVPIQEK